MQALFFAASAPYPYAHATQRKEAGGGSAKERRAVILCRSFLLLVCFLRFPRHHATATRHVQRWRAFLRARAPRRARQQEMI